MKTLLALILTGPLLSPLTVLAQDTPQPLGNRDVTAMVAAKLSTAIIVAKIESSPCAFDTRPDALRELKNQGVTEEIILAMVRADLSERADSHAPQTLKLPAGTPVEIVTKYDISSAEVRAGDVLTFIVSEPVKINGVTVIEEGAKVVGVVTKAHQGRPFGKAGRLAWEIKHVVAANGERVALTFTKSAVGDSKGGTVATATVVTAVLLLPVAPVALLWGFKRGKPAIIPAGKAFHAFVLADINLSVK
jgi:hypothetical protein